MALWRCLAYLVNHGTQQFAEAAVLLTRLGQSADFTGFRHLISREFAT
jgi:uncharacterized damage-inducible protein DinB